MTYIANEAHVYHYTDVNALVSILENHELWFSDASCLNDSSDGVYIAELYREAADQLQRELEDDPHGLANYYLNLVKENVRFQSWQQFVGCFSKNFDSSSQWMNYGGAGGYCIAFDRKELAPAVKELSGVGLPQSFWDGYVNYDGKQKIYDEVKTRLNAYRDRVTADDDESRAYATRHAEWVTDSMQLMNSIRFKHSSWRNEEEYRIALLPPRWSLEPRNSTEQGCWRLYLPRRAFIKPTAALRFGPKFVTMIKAIRVGPGPTAAIAKKTLERLLGHLGYNVPVLLSECGYRSP
jgi:hypothetical protein